jgi:DNA-3-methyladenine glycosylase II
MKQVIDHLKKVDPVLGAVIDRLDEFPSLKPRDTRHYFESLTSEIIGQQLSGKVADVIFDRFTKLFPSGEITPRLLLQLQHEQLRSTGMSNSKARFLKDLAEKVINKSLKLEDLINLDNETVIKELMQVKGIGPWTAEMFLMFTLGREDIFSHGDLGLKNAIKKLYRIESPTRDQVEEISKKWSPYRTFACRILWQSLELKD